MPIKVQEAYGMPNRLGQKRKSTQYIITKMLNVHNNKRILKGKRKKDQVL